jgi:hypothetical protein
MAKRIPQEKKLLVEKLASQGKSDVEIITLTGLTFSYIQKTTTAYWKRKMREAYPEIK